MATPGERFLTTTRAQRGWAGRDLLDTADATDGRVVAGAVELAGRSLVLLRAAR